jgi:hypothetical protein
MTTQVTDKVKKIKASLSFSKMSDADLLKLLDAILKSMTGNPAFPSPPGLLSIKLCLRRES